MNLNLHIEMESKIEFHILFHKVLLIYFDIKFSAHPFFSIDWRNPRLKNKVINDVKNNRKDVSQSKNRATFQFHYGILHLIGIDRMAYSLNTFSLRYSDHMLTRSESDICGSYLERGLGRCTWTVVFPFQRLIVSNPI